MTSPHTPALNLPTSFALSGDLRGNCRRAFGSSSVFLKSALLENLSHGCRRVKAQVLERAYQGLCVVGSHASKLHGISTKCLSALTSPFQERLPENLRA